MWQQRRRFFRYFVYGQYFKLFHSSLYLVCRPTTEVEAAHFDGLSNLISVRARFIHLFRDDNSVVFFEF